jgi:hypothetical protein
VIIRCLRWSARPSPTRVCQPVARQLGSQCLHQQGAENGVADTHHQEIMRGHAGNRPTARRRPRRALSRSANVGVPHAPEGRGANVRQHVRGVEGGHIHIIDPLSDWREFPALKQPLPQQQLGIIPTQGRDATPDVRAGVRREDDPVAVKEHARHRGSVERSGDDAADIASDTLAFADGKVGTHAASTARCGPSGDRDWSSAMSGGSQGTRAIGACVAHSARMRGRRALHAFRIHGRPPSVTRLSDCPRRGQCDRWEHTPQGSGERVTHPGTREAARPRRPSPRLSAHHTSWHGRG